MALNKFIAAKFAPTATGKNMLLVCAAWTVLTLAAYSLVPNPSLLLFGLLPLGFTSSYRSFFTKGKTVVPETLLLLTILHIELIFPIHRAYLLLVYPLLYLHIIFHEKNRFILAVLAIVLFVSLSITLANAFVIESMHVIHDIDIIFFIGVGLEAVFTLFATIQYFRQVKFDDEQALKKNIRLETLASFFDSAPLTLMQLTLDGQVVEANEMASKLLLKDENKFSFPPGVAECIFESLRLQHPQDVVTRVGNKIFHFVCQPTADNNHIALYGEDVTAIEQARSTVQELSDAMDFAADGLGIIKKDGSFIYTNQSFNQLFQQSSSLNSSNWFELFDAIWQEKFRRELFPEVQAKCVWRGEAVALNKNNEPNQIALTITRIQGGNMIASVRDNNAFKSAQNDLIAAKESAEKATKAKSEFLATMSHEIRTPLNGVLGMTKILAGTKLTHEQAALLETIENSGENLMHIINEILDFSKIEAGKMPLNFAPVQLTKLVADALSLVSEHATDKGISLSSKISHRVPSVVEMDKERLIQIINNLLSNAVKFTSSGSVEFNLDAKSLDTNTIELIIAISDTGIGIAEKDLALLFQPFSQVDSSSSRTYNGTGLGLAICKQLTELLGGSIQVSSSPGFGSCFSVRIPAQLSVFKEPVKKLPAIDHQLSSRLPYSILVAEDNLVNQKLAMFVFEKMGYDIDVANNGLEAVEMSDIKKYDLIFMDLQMPVMDGIEATKIILARNTEKPTVVALTANVLEESKNACFEAGMTHFIYKPFTLDAIQNVLESTHKKEKISQS